MTNQPKISASRVPMMLGESKYGTPLSLYLELRGEAPEREDNELLQEGREFEAAIAKIACRKFNLRMVAGPRELVHVDLVGHPDFYVIDEHGKLAILEIKHTLFSDGTEDSGWGEAGTDRVPMSYLLQAMVYGHLLRAQSAIHVGMDTYGRDGLSETVYLVARLWHGTRLYQIKVDPEIIAKIEAEASAFLDRVARGEPPDPTTGQEFRQRWSPVPEKSVEFTEAQVAMLRARQQLKQQIKLAEAEVEQLDIALLGFMQDAAVGLFRGAKVLSAGADRSFDERAFEVAHPDVYGRFLRKLDKDALRREYAGLYEQFLRQPPAEQQVRKLRVNDKQLGAIQ